MTLQDIVEIELIEAGSYQYKLSEKASAEVEGFAAGLGIPAFSENIDADIWYSCLDRYYWYVVAGCEMTEDLEDEEFDQYFDLELDWLYDLGYDLSRSPEEITPEEYMNMVIELYVSSCLGPNFWYEALHKDDSSSYTYYWSDDGTCTPMIVNKINTSILEHKFDEFVNLYAKYYFNEHINLPDIITVFDNDDLLNLSIFNEETFNKIKDVQHISSNMDDVLKDFEQGEPK